MPKAARGQSPSLSFPSSSSSALAKSCHRSCRRANSTFEECQSSIVIFSRTRKLQRPIYTNAPTDRFAFGPTDGPGQATTVLESNIATVLRRLQSHHWAMVSWLEKFCFPSSGPTPSGQLGRASSAAGFLPRATGATKPRPVCFRPECIWAFGTIGILVDKRTKEGGSQTRLLSRNPPSHEQMGVFHGNVAVEKANPSSVGVT